MSQESQVLDPYAIVLADLRAKRAQIDAAIKAIEDLMGGATRSPAHSDADTGSGSPVPSEGPGAFLGMTVVDATKKLLATRRQTLPNSEIVSALERGGLVLNSVDKLNTVGSILTRRFKQVGDIVRVSRGTWGLQEWYGSRNFKKKPAKADDDISAIEDAIDEAVAVELQPVPPPPPHNDPDDSWSPIDEPRPGVFR